MCSALSKAGGTQILKNSKRGEEPKKIWGRETKRKGGRFSKIKGGAQLFKLNSGIEKYKNQDFYRQISINFFKNLSAAANITTFLDIYCVYHA